MTQEVSSNLVKIIVGIVVAVIVISGIAILFGSKLNDFFSDGLGDDDIQDDYSLPSPETSDSSSAGEKKLTCGNCGYFCSRKKCISLGEDCNFESLSFWFINIKRYGKCFS